MKGLKILLAATVVVSAAALPLQSSAYGPYGWGGPWGGPWGGGPWGAPGLYHPGGLANIPGWSPEEVADKYDFYAPYGPSITDIRRFHRDLWWGRPLDDLYSPMGPSPTDIRRKERRDFYRSMGFPY